MITLIYQHTVEWGPQDKWVNVRFSESDGSYTSFKAFRVDQDTYVHLRVSPDCRVVTKWTFSLVDGEAYVDKSVLDINPKSFNTVNSYKLFEEVA